ncbi:MAG TPA: ribose-phosphate pyrophosphokinase [Acidimicrobiia bacterium]|nr:ribose-phosphate pyrophosphokinase [Acidimicrobiia bacterium]
MTLSLLSGSAHPQLGQEIGEILGVVPTVCEVERFPDGELQVKVGPLNDGDVYIVQPTGPPVNDHMVELLLLIDACRRESAGRITAVIPYLGYARQDRRTAPGQSVASQVFARAITTSGADRVVVVDPHTPAVETLFDVPVELLTAVPVLARALEKHIGEDTVIVAPDLGAVKLAEHYGSALGRTVVIVRKTRHSGTEVSVEEVVGDVVGRHVVIVDDMISTGATIRAAAGAVLERGALPDLVVAATHGLLVSTESEGPIFPTIQHVLVTDSVAARPIPDVPLEVVSIASLLADGIERLHNRRPLDDLAMRR